jgi:von Willebrand factor type A domain
LFRPISDGTFDEMEKFHGPGTGVRFAVVIEDMKRTLHTRRLLIVPSLALAVALVGCSPDKSKPTSTEAIGAALPSVAKAPKPAADGTTADPVGSTGAGSESKGGWIGGEPEWTGPGAGASDVADAVGAAGAVGAVERDAGVAYTDGPADKTAMAAETTAALADDTYAAAAETAAASAELRESAAPVDVKAKRVAPAGAAYDADRGDLVPYPDEPPAVNQAPLKAGSVDDNVTFADYMEYRTRIENQGTPVRQLSIHDRTVIRLRKANGLPASQRALTIRSGNQVVTRLLTTADGTVRFHPSAYNANGPFTVDVDGTLEQFTAGNNVDILVPDARATAENVPVEVLFLLDTTGSMGDEIDQLKTTIDSVVQRLNDLPGTGEIRLGMTLYRDQNDAFVIANYDFTNNIGSFRKALAQVGADGGGDEPEALDEAFADALAKPHWSAPGKAIQLVFLVADAPPHVDRPVQVPYTSSMKEAASRGIKVFPIASSSTGDQGEYIFRQIAQFTGARFVFLSYGAQGSGGTATGESSDMKQRDYQELSLDELVVRLVGEEAQARITKVRPGFAKDLGTQAPKPIGQ